MKTQPPVAEEERALPGHAVHAIAPRAEGLLGELAAEALHLGVGGHRAAHREEPVDPADQLAAHRDVEDAPVDREDLGRRPDRALAPRRRPSPPGATGVRIGAGVGAGRTAAAGRATAARRELGRCRLRAGAAGAGAACSARSASQRARSVRAPGLLEPRPRGARVARLEEREPQVAHGLAVLGVEVERDGELPHRLGTAAALQPGQPQVHAPGDLDRVVVHEPAVGLGRLLVEAGPVAGLAEQPERGDVPGQPGGGLPERVLRPLDVAGGEPLRRPASRWCWNSSSTVAIASPVPALATRHPLAFRLFSCS